MYVYVYVYVYVCIYICICMGALSYCGCTLYCIQRIYKTVYFAAALKIIAVIFGLLFKCRDNGLFKVACSYSKPAMVPWRSDMVI